MQSELRRARVLLAAGGVLTVVHVADVVQGAPLLALFLAGLWIRRATAEAPVHNQTGIAVSLLGLAPVLHVAGLQGHVAGALTAPAWAAGILLSMWAAARALDHAGKADAPVWSIAYVAGLLLWTPVAILDGRVLWATQVTGVDGVEFGVKGVEAFLVMSLMVAPFLLLFGTTAWTPNRVEVRA